MQKALEQDSSVYEYDSVYDDIQKQRLESNKKLLGGADKKVGFICVVQFECLVSSMCLCIIIWIQCEHRTDFIAMCLGRCIEVHFSPFSPNTLLS